MRSVVTFALAVGESTTGSLELYRTPPGELTVVQHTTAAMIGSALVAEVAATSPTDEVAGLEHVAVEEFRARRCTRPSGCSLPSSLARRSSTCHGGEHQSSG